MASVSAAILHDTCGHDQPVSLGLPSCSWGMRCWSFELNNAAEPIGHSPRSSYEVARCRQGCGVCHWPKPTFWLALQTGFCCRCHSYCLGSSLSNSWEGPGRVTCKCGKVTPCRKSFDQLETETGGKFFTLTHRNRNLIVSYQERGINRVCQQAVDSFITHSLSSFASSC